MIFLDVDPSVVKPGWTPLIITILLAGVIVLLMISMRRQIRKIKAPRLEDLDRDTSQSRSETTGESPDAAEEADGQDADGGQDEPAASAPSAGRSSD
jgi:hypothetical protein